MNNQIQNQDFRRDCDAASVSMNARTRMQPDKLWKGKRDSEFEQQAVSRFAEHLGKDDWEVFMEADKMFESVADLGHQRLEATRA